MSHQHKTPHRTRAGHFTAPPRIDYADPIGPRKPWERIAVRLLVLGTLGGYVAALGYTVAAVVGEFR
jgi:hypothetical protein